MKFYKNAQNNIYAYESDGSQDAFILVDLISITESEANQIRTPQITTNQIWVQIKLERDRRKTGGVKLVVGGVDKWFHSDADSRIQVFGLKDRARDMVASGGTLADTITILGNPVNWKTMDGTFVTMTGQLAFDIVEAIGDVDAQLHTKAEWHKDQMLASSTPSSYDYSGGWGLIYGE